MIGAAKKRNRYHEKCEAHIDYYIFYRAIAMPFMIVSKQSVRGEYHNIRSYHRRPWNSEFYHIMRLHTHRKELLEDTDAEYRDVSQFFTRTYLGWSSQKSRPTEESF